jgi:NADH:ubiquinone oxidoreductase subunit 3 (subunit A)
VARAAFGIFRPDDSPRSPVPGGRVSAFHMTSTYLTDWIYVWLFIAAGGALVVLILLFSKLLNPSHLTPEKLAPYECGIPPVGNPWAPFAVRYYVFGLLFLVFDVEAVFLFPWALVFRTLGTAGFVEMLLFIAVLGFGLLYAWRKGALEWA